MRIYIDNTRYWVSRNRSQKKNMEDGSKLPLPVISDRDCWPMSAEPFNESADYFFSPLLSAEKVHLIGRSKENTTDYANQSLDADAGAGREAAPLAVGWITWPVTLSR